MRWVVLVCLTGCQILFPLDGAPPDAPPECQAELDVDPDNCGACGNICESGVCSGGSCGAQILTQGHDRPERMAATDSFVYWANLGNGTIHRYQVGARIVETITTRPGVSDVAVDDDHVYISANGGLIRCAHADGCTGTTILVQCQSGGQIALSASDAYHYCPASATIHRIAKASPGSPDQIASSQAVTGIAADGSDVYWGVMTTSSILASLAGANATQIIPGTATDVSTLAIDTTNVYWAALDGVGVNTFDRSRVIGTTLSTADANVRALAVRDATVFYAGGLEIGFVRSCPLAGCGGAGVDRLPGPIEQPVAIAVTDAHIYFSTAGGTIQRIAR